MTTIIKELVDGHSYEAVLAGFEIVRVYHISGLVDIPERQLIEAANDPGVPDLGATYPGTVGILLVRKNVVPDGPNAARVILTYSAEKNVSTFNQPEPVSNDGQDVKQISAGTREVITTTDRDGASLLLPTPASYGGTNPGALPPYLSEARVLVPAGQVVFERVEKSPAVTTARDLVGKVNNAPIGIYGINTLLFASLDAVSNDGGFLWNCTYTFQFDFSGWKHIDSWHDPAGRVPDDATPESFNVLEEASFAGLGLDFTASQTPIS